MDNTKLTDQQLARLITFIERRGFRDPAVVVEILDHFACKVEEKLALSPRLTIDEAIAEAHRTFGVRGFQPLADAYNQQFRKRYWSVYRRELKKILASPYYMLPVLLFALIMYKCCAWGAFKLFDITFNLFADFVFLGIFSFVSLFVYQLRKTTKQGRYLPPIGQFTPYIFIGIVQTINHHPHSPKGIIVFGIFNAIVVFLVLIDLLASYAASKIFRDQLDPLYTYLEQKKANTTTAA